MHVEIIPATIGDADALTVIQQFEIDDTAAESVKLVFDLCLQYDCGFISFFFTANHIYPSSE